MHETFTGASDAIVASRLSYYLDLKGPAFVVNTGCSSSGVALHLACESLRNGESTLALAGGAFAVMGQTILVGLSQTDMLSHSGRSRSFDADADGMVMSEGVGMVALKRLDQAIADGDPVYGVIRASGLNQDGASNGITAPSGEAQQALIADVYRRFGIDPERISYVEAHGTGTRLGDPVEANALVHAFRQFTKRANYCAIGSAKSHIGHTSANAGVTGLISVLLSLKHRQLPGLRNFDRLNPLIDLAGSAFYPNIQTTAWRSADGQPRMAALNSFGHSGTNVHLVIEEFVPQAAARAVTGAEAAQPELIVLSAKDETRLREVMERLRAFVRGTDQSLGDIAYTLQVGRTALEQRIAFVVRTLSDLESALAAALSGETSAAWTGHVEPKRGRGVGGKAEDASHWLATRALDRLAEAFVNGAAIDWRGLKRDCTPRRIHLPTYPFARERYWKRDSAPTMPMTAQLHPLVHRNVSTLQHTCFEATLTGAEFFLCDHVVQDQKVLPGVACIEMGLAAIAHALGGASGFEPARFESIVWTAPAPLTTQTLDLAIAIDQPDGDRIGYRVTSRAPDGRKIQHHQGVALLSPPQAVAPNDLAALRSRIGGETVSADACYAAFAANGVRHGVTLKALHNVQVGRDEALAELRLPADIAASSSAFTLHPAMMDAALQATVALALDREDGGEALLPFALDALDVFAPCEASMFAWIRLGANRKLDIDMMSRGGEVCVRMQGLTSRALTATSSERIEGTDAAISRYDGREFVLRDHNGMMPAAVFLDLAWVAARKSGVAPSALMQVVWPQPMMTDGSGGEITTRLMRQNEALSFSIGSDRSTDLHCQGQIVAGSADAAPARQDVTSIIARCTSSLDKAQCDALLRGTHGPSLLSITQLHHNVDEALALIELPNGLVATHADYALHPSLLNGAILTAVVWALANRPGAALPMPFSLERLRVFAPLGPRLYAHVSASGKNASTLAAFDISLLDPEGWCLATFERFTLVFAATQDELLFATPQWIERPLPALSVPSAPMTEPLFILAEPDDVLRRALAAHWPSARIETFNALTNDASAVEDFFHELLRTCQKLLIDSTGVQPLLLLGRDETSPFFAGLTAFVKTLRLEHARIAAKCISYAASSPTAMLVDLLAHEIAASDGDVEVRLGDGPRQVRVLSEIDLGNHNAVIGAGDVVWITGGLGGIGRLVARHFAARKATVVLSGRSVPDADGQQFIESLRRDGADASYLACDVGEFVSVHDAVAQIRRRHGKLDAVVHSAGVIDDKPVASKDAAQMARVLRPKIAGVLALDDATRDLPLKALVLFSSIAGVLGNPGQADYAGANAFLDAFARARNAQVRRGERTGKTLSINWPLWRDGGMRMGHSNETLMRHATGMAAMDAASGLHALDQALAGEHTQVMVAYGDKAAMRARLLTFRHESPPTLSKPAAGNNDDELTRAVSSELIRVVAEVQRIQPDRIALRRDLSDYGFDSISFTEFANALNRTYGLTLMPTLFFEIADLASLAEHLIARHRDALLRKHGVVTPSVMARAPIANPVPKPLPRFTAAPIGHPLTDTTAIAVIGIGGKFPGAADVHELWRHIEANRDLITEVPSQRWDWRTIYGDPHTEPGKTRVKWGGFVADADCFDAGFFGISPADAESMDPQLRLFLEATWATIEDSGYPASALSGTRTGVFAGVATADYKELCVEARRNGMLRSANEPFPFMVANRVSYWFNFHGPSEAIDTACSSSLIAIHRAIESIRNGHCDVALAGGVNVLASPRITIASNQASMLSEDGRCMTFDARANGYVRSEGVAVLMLKPLHKAEADGDRVYGVIRASGENHGGRSSSPTAPNAAAQKQLLVDVYSRAGIDPRTIGYIEAHGTGTALGDPVEINGLKAAFAELYARDGLALPDAPSCALGSVKTNVGHLEAAAGATGVVKALLMLRHRRIPGNPHLTAPNPFLQLDGTPFSLADATRDWQAPLDARGNALPRRAGVSSFGVGGSNAHVVVEEHITTARGTALAVTSPSIIVLSAKNEDRLRESAARLLAFIRAERDALALHDLAYTLQVGREAMPQRLAFRATTLDDAELMLAAHVEGSAPVQGLHTGQARQHDDNLAAFATDEDMAATFDAWIAKGKHDRLIPAWVSGFAIDWRRLYPGSTPRRIGLPTYPFARDRYWVPTTPAIPNAAPSVSATPAPDDAVLVFEEVWEPSPLGDVPASPAGTILCFASRLTHQDIIAAQVRELDPHSRVIFVEQGHGPARISASRYRIDAARTESYAEALRAIRDEADSVDAVLYLWPLDDPRYVRDVSPVLHLLQATAAAGLKPRRLVMSGLYTNAVERCHLDSWVAFERSLGPVMSDMQAAVVFSSDGVSMRDWTGTLLDALRAPQLRSASYISGVRHVPVTRAIDTIPSTPSRIRHGGTYLITGGCGGLGMIVAAHLAETYAARLLLTGRSPQDAAIDGRLRRLRELGGDAIYAQASVTDEAAMRTAIASAEERFGKIDGAFHIAGTSGAARILDATAAGFGAVLAPKVDGTLVLDRVLHDQTPDFICHFSSSSAILGDFGSCDYALGNRFQTAHARHREGRGRHIAINWPLWRDGGRGVGDAEQTRLYLASSGQRALTSEEGIALLERLLGGNQSQYLVLAGEPERLSRIVERSPRTDSMPAMMPAPPTRDGHESLEKRVARDLKDRARHLLKHSGEVSATANLADLGFDSISLAEFSRVLSRFYALEISPSVFFSYPTLRSLAAHLASTYRSALDAFYRQNEGPRASLDVIPAPQPANDAIARPAAPAQVNAAEPIAIIGMSGRFPKARNVDELWDILASGRDAVDEVPPSRFDWRHIYDPSGSAPDKTNSKWCGAIPGIEEFDPLFFEISPLEAERMDPRQRHLLQESWLALENAGCGPQQISRQRIGMFVGVEEGSDYQRRVKQLSLTSSHNGVLASRLAYFLNLKGPVLAINTACSSGLVAAHMACTSLRQGECDTAIAAGVNLMVSPEAYIGMTQAGMLSPDGKCYAFDKRANGMVPGEAVAVVVLKRLSRALADGDPIHAVIRGTGVNYDGRTNGITAPSGAAQAELLRDIHKECALRPRDIDYIVAHGTATQLGDPVEVNALNDVFQGDGAPGRCALTSIKSNLGHTFAASGLVSLIGLVEAMRHRTIPASLHCERENDFIHWVESPFRVSKQAAPWTETSGRPRIGAVSAFGISGTNAHMVVQQHVAATQVASVAPAYVLALSARTAASLTDYIRQTAAWLRTPQAAEAGIAAISHTMLQGRHHFEHRCTVVARDVNDAAIGFESLIDGSSPHSHHGIVSRDFSGEAPIRAALDDRVRRARAATARPDEYIDALHALSALHCEGYDVPWDALHAVAPRRISIPGYPFARERYWIDEEPQVSDAHAIAAEATSVVAQAPQPAVNFDSIAHFSCLELARTTAQEKLGRPVPALQNMVWGKPSTPSNAKQFVTLHGDGNAHVYAVSASDRAATCDHLGEIVTDGQSDTPPQANLARLRAGLKPPAHALPGRIAKQITDVYASASQVVATLTLPRDAHSAAMFQPICLAASMQLAQLVTRSTDLVPYSLRRIEAAGVPPQQLTIHLSLKPGSAPHEPTFDATFYDDAGRACLWLRDFTLTTPDRLFDIPMQAAP
jgi:acyl transferase domain-containing protein/NAD(P)-dependent dehydrogenase (short-subunit alcohol dehydrogenase family)/acyl carrier protein